MNRLGSAESIQLHNIKIIFDFFFLLQNVVLMCFSIDKYVTLDNVQNKWWEEIR